jgi:uncharacterized membrane protein YfcA
MPDAPCEARAGDDNLTVSEIFFLVATGFLAGVSNALVGGGTLFSFPVLLAAGLSPIIANTTAKIALVPGAVTSAYAYLPELQRVRQTLPMRTAVAVAGGLLGAVLLLLSGNAVFFYFVPWLLAFATALFTFAKPLVRWMRRAAHGQRNDRQLLGTEFVCAIYGGYFGAAIGIFMLASMALAGEQDAHSMNAQRNFLVCFNGGIAALLFAFGGIVNWPVALIVMAGSVSGGYVGARLTKLIPSEWLRHLITAAGAIFSVYYFIEAYG